MKKNIYGALALVILGTFAVASRVGAETKPTNRPAQKSEMMRNGVKDGIRKGFENMKPAVVGKVTAINGKILTITGGEGFERGRDDDKTRATTTPVNNKIFTVDATNATVFKSNATSTFATIAVGDTVAVQGTINGTTVVATSIHDNQMGGQPRPIMQGNGQPIIAGTISAISGSSVTITNNSNTAYSVDASAVKNISDLKVGDTVVVQGTINGTSVTASSITNHTKKSFFGGMGQFFMRMFGF